MPSSHSTLDPGGLEKFSPACYNQDPRRSKVCSCSFRHSAHPLQYQHLFPTVDQDFPGIIKGSSSTRPQPWNRLRALMLNTQREKQLGKLSMIKPRFVIYVNMVIYPTIILLLFKGIYYFSYLITVNPCQDAVSGVQNIQFPWSLNESNR